MNGNKLLAFIGGIVVLFIGALFYAFVLSALWNWFIATTFAICELGIVQAYGLSLVIRLLVTDLTITRKTFTFAESIYYALAVSVVFYCTGWFVHLFL